MGADLHGTLIVSLRMHPQKIIGKNGYIIHPVAQRRHLYHYCVNPVEEVLPEPPLAYHLHEVTVGGAYQPYVNRYLPVGTYPDNMPVLQNAQEFRLAAEREVAYFVKEEGSLMCLFKLALAIFPGISECPFDMSEKLTFKQCLRN